MTHRGTRVDIKPELGANTSEKEQKIDPEPKPSQASPSYDASQVKPSQVPELSTRGARRQRSPDDLGLERAMSFRQEGLRQDVRPRRCRYLI